MINRFSEDVDLALIVKPGITGNQIKSFIRSIEKEITSNLREIVLDGVTSKGSLFRKAVYQYPITLKQKVDISDTFIVEINSFANPFPYSKIMIQSMIGEFLQNVNQNELIHKYALEAFEVNVLNKEQTLIEKLVSLLRFSFDDNAIESISGKIRHFYDLYYLLQDETCENYVKSMEFKDQFVKVMAHDQQQFDEPLGWNRKKIEESPLIKNFEPMWEKLKTKYTNELSILAYSEIPKEKEVAESFINLIYFIDRDKILSRK